jgi:hypothetical protein
MVAPASFFELCARFIGLLPCRADVKTIDITRERAFRNRGFAAAEPIDFFYRRDVHYLGSNASIS